ncbi:MAG: hypothetical protein CBB71_05935 [Rhodopirellula sp. TMED11]|nr:MAG: hypothetical protein CBB71_05935 [Rhodopirellula sp. TMED11]
MAGQPSFTTSTLRLPALIGIASFAGGLHRGPGRSPLFECGRFSCALLLRRRAEPSSSAARWQHGFANPYKWTAARFCSVRPVNFVKPCQAKADVDTDA